MKLLIPVVCSLLLIGCSDTPPAESAAPSETPAAVESAPQDMNTSPAEEQTAPVPTEETAPAPAPVPSAEPEKPKPAPEAAVKAEKPATKASPTPAPEAAPKAIEAAVDGAMIFTQKCASCHGQKAEKSALGKSQVIAGWPAQQVQDALHGYQAGTYGKEMKGIMQAQAKALSDAQVAAVAKHISSL